MRKQNPGLLLLLVCMTTVWASSTALGRKMTDVETAAREFIARRVTTPCDSIGITIDLPDIENLEVTSYRFDLYTDRAIVGTVPFKVILNIDGSDQTFTATARVRLFKKVAVAARRLSRHEIVGVDDVRMETRDITLLTDRYFEDVDSVLGKRTRRVINAGRIVEFSDLEDIPDIERGADVMVSVVIGAVTVTAKAQALEDGSIGDRIIVRDLTTGKRLTVTVVGKGLAVLDKAML